ncbi:Solute carrier family 13 member [Echinococcus granulosus]|uniref:Solute carrier family 13 member n=1 Tax=Echinococcus granulosus TaxID=6210 RepID=W6U2B5_ECHGR|nr:Solute carrier family 13 member [Echinococcus granulosus]EUB55250.1 Solute carrier family 13 member [Echinococcus granulosus]
MRARSTSKEMKIWCLGSVSLDPVQVKTGVSINQRPRFRCLYLLMRMDTKSAYILLWMSGYWITGVVPLYATALLPMLAGPIMGLQTSGTLSREYLPTSNFLFIASMFLAGAAEHCNLHRRVVIFCLRCMGGDPRLILLGIMIPTWFLSLWMSNSATTLLMVTITETLLNRIDEVTKSKRISDKVEPELESKLHLATTPFQALKALWRKETPLLTQYTLITSHSTPNLFRSKSSEESGEELSPNRSKWQKFGVGLSLSVCYSASCGGMGTLTGTPTNIVVYNLLTDVYGSETGLNFGSWMAYAFPISLIILLCIWFTICLIYLGPKQLFSCRRTVSKSASSASDEVFTIEESEEGHESKRKIADISLADIVQKIIEEEEKVIGSMTWAEGTVLTLFISVVILWIGREPGVPGWSLIMPTKTNSKGRIIHYVGDTQPIVLVAFLALVLPYNNPFKLRNCPDEMRKEALARLNRPLLPWSEAEKKCAWGVIILIGGGFALSKIVTSSGLSTVISDSLVGLNALPPFAIVYILTVMCSFLTEMVSNTATVTILTPIMFELADKLAIHPFCLTLPLVLATSLAFILPAATPPNAIIFAKGRVRLIDMMKTGVILNCVAQAVVTVGTITYGVPLFGLNAVPDWALNITSRY